MSRIRVTVIYSTDKLRLADPMHAEHLIVHLGNPGPTVEVGEHDLTWGKIETVGVGNFTLLRRGRQYMQITRETP